MTTVGDLKRLLALLPDDAGVWIIDDDGDAPIAFEVCAQGRRGPANRPVQQGAVALLGYPGTDDYREVCDALRHTPLSPSDRLAPFVSRRCLRCGHIDDGSRGWAVYATGMALCQGCVLVDDLTHPLPPFDEDLDLEDDATDPFATDNSDVGDPPTMEVA